MAITVKDEDPVFTLICEGCHRKLQYSKEDIEKGYEETRDYITCPVCREINFL